MELYSEDLFCYVVIVRGNWCEDLGIVEDRSVLDLWNVAARELVFVSKLQLLGFWISSLRADDYQTRVQATYPLLCLRVC